MEPDLRITTQAQRRRARGTLLATAIAAVRRSIVTPHRPSVVYRVFLSQQPVYESRRQRECHAQATANADEISPPCRRHPKPKTLTQGFALKRLADDLA